MAKSEGAHRSVHGRIYIHICIIHTITHTYTQYKHTIHTQYTHNTHNTHTHTHTHTHIYYVYIAGPQGSTRTPPDPPTSTTKQLV
jgi:hypothetical protein